jgi:hypothetical protein
VGLVKRDRVKAVHLHRLRLLRRLLRRHLRRLRPRHLRENVRRMKCK